MHTLSRAKICIILKKTKNAAKFTIHGKKIWGKMGKEGQKGGERREREGKKIPVRQPPTGIRQ